MYGITTSGIKQPPKDTAKILEQNNIRYVDCSVTNLLQKNWSEVSTENVKQLHRVYRDHNIQFSSLQSIFYGLDLDFSILEHRQNIIDHVKRLIEYCDILETKRLLFGSPKQRAKLDRTNIFLETLESVDYLTFEADKSFSIENLDLIRNIEYPSANDIGELITRNKLKSCTINLHLFIDAEVCELANFDFAPVDAIHLSKMNYKTDLLFRDQISDKIANLLVEKECYKIIEFADEELEVALENIKNNFL